MERRKEEEGKEEEEVVVLTDKLMEDKAINLQQVLQNDMAEKEKNKGQQTVPANSPIRPEEGKVQPNSLPLESPEKSDKPKTVPDPERTTFYARPLLIFA